MNILLKIDISDKSHKLAPLLPTLEKKHSSQKNL